MFRDTILVLNRLVSDGIIGRYAIGGAWAAFQYMQPTLTYDIDILVSFDEIANAQRGGLITLQPIKSHLAKLGYTKETNEGFEIEGWPVQFIPVADALDKESLDEARHLEVGDGEEAFATWMLQPHHVVAKALQLGRPEKDHHRIASILNGGAVDLTTLRDVLVRHNMRQDWERFRRTSGLAEVLQW
jgi:hypothetical protein